MMKKLVEMRKTIAIVTESDNTPSLNLMVRAVARAALHRHYEVFAIYEGFKGVVEGGNHIRRMIWKDVSGILSEEDIIIGSVPYEIFKNDEAVRRQAVCNLVSLGIEALVIIGDDGSLTEANVLRQEWSRHVETLVKEGKVKKSIAKKHPALFITGLIGSVNSNMNRTDIATSPDLALARIVEAVEATISTAASHQRTFVVKVMGRDCGYLAVMAGLACGADWVLIPEDPPQQGTWEKDMCDLLIAGRKAGRSESIVILAEGVRDTQGNPISAAYIQKILQERLEEDVRTTVLGQVQRGGVSRAYDRYMTTLLGLEAISRIAESSPEDEPLLIGVQENSSLTNLVNRNQSKAENMTAFGYFHSQLQAHSQKSLKKEEEVEAIKNVSNGVREILEKWFTDDWSENQNLVEEVHLAVKESWGSTKFLPGKVARITEKRIYCECILDKEKGAIETRSFPKHLFSHIEHITIDYPILLVIQTKPGSYRIDILDGMGRVDLSLLDRIDGLKELIDSGMGQPLNL